MCIVKDKYYIRIRLYAQQLNYMIELQWKFSRSNKMFEFFWELGDLFGSKG